MEIEFFGAAGEVTGSCHILKIGDHRILLDCGMIQGSREDEERNRDPFPFEARDINAVVLSHAHIDHSGRLPLLVKRGFKGPIYAQNASVELAEILLADAANLEERDTEYLNRKRERKGLEPLEPLYSRADAKDVTKRLRGLPYREEKQILPGIRICYRDAGHILGSAIVEVWLEEGDLKRKLVFSGDVGQYDTPILHDPASIEHADLVLMESTYGNRRHRDRIHTITEIGEIISAAKAGKGNVLVPAFAVGRSQEMLYQFGVNYTSWDLGRWHVFLDSPLAIKASKIYWDYDHLYDEDATKLRRKINEMPRLHNLHLTSTTEESQVISKIRNGAIILAGSGMCNGGRIVHHLKHNIWRDECHVIIVGYQAYGSLGRRLVDGKPTVRIHGDELRVRAHIHTVGGLSAHGDQEDLGRWYDGFRNRPPVYLVHGEIEAAKAFKKYLHNKYSTDVTLTQPGLRLDLASLAPK